VDEAPFFNRFYFDHVSYFKRHIILLSVLVKLIAEGN
jgi:hypothetical protein